MHIELAELFRCLEDHAPTWLVVSAFRSHNRIVLDGMLGCPLCGAEYPIEAGVVDFTQSSEPAGNVSEATGANDVHRPHESHCEDTVDVMRVAALLNLGSSSSLFAIEGSQIKLALDLQSITPVRLLLINPDDQESAEAALRTGDSPSPIAIMRVAKRVPLAEQSLAGVLLRSGSPESYVSLLRPDGRLVSPIGFDIPSGIAELARDDRQWVGERKIDRQKPAFDSLIQLTRR